MHRFVFYERNILYSNSSIPKADNAATINNINDDDDDDEVRRISGNNKSTTAWDTLIDISDNHAITTNLLPLQSSTRIVTGWLSYIYRTTAHVLTTTFLPAGYPHSVKSEYLTYQFWDSIQCISSSIRSVLGTRSVLAGVGVGSVEANALSAAVTWVLRDGFGMFGSLVFAYYYSNAFEIYIKEFRYLADVLNNIGLTLDLLSSHFPQYYIIIISCSTVCKSLCGLIAGATKARISAHFASSPGNLADITAKESTQETAVSLIGLILGIVVAKLLGDHDGATWITFILLMTLHLYSNYCLVRVLIFETLNPQRCYLLTRQALIHSHSSDLLASRLEQVNSDDDDDDACRRVEGTSSQQLIALTSPFEIAKQENLILPFYLLIDGPIMGASMSSIISSIDSIMKDSRMMIQTHYKINSISEFMSQYLAVFQQCMFLIGINQRGRVVVCVQDGITVDSIVKAYFISYYVYLHINKPSSSVVRAHIISSSIDNTAYSNDDAASNLIHLLDTLIPQAFRWYDSLIMKVIVLSPSSGRTEGVDHDHSINNSSSSHHHPKGPSSLRWDVSDVSGLYCGSIRYRENMKEKME